MTMQGGRLEENVGVNVIESEVRRSTFLIQNEVYSKRDQTLSSWPNTFTKSESLLRHT